MKKLITIFVLIFFSTSAIAQIPERKFKNLPEGTFKKTKNGTIVQYYKSGKKVGTYKMNNGKYVKSK